MASRPERNTNQLKNDAENSPFLSLAHLLVLLDHDFLALGLQFDLKLVLILRTLNDSCCFLEKKLRMKESNRIVVADYFEFFTRSIRFRKWASDS